MENFELEIVNSTTDVLAILVLTTISIDRIKDAQNLDAEVAKIKEKIRVEPFDGFELKDNGSLWKHKRLCVPRDEELKPKILKKAHNSKFSIHPGGTKMY